MAIFEAKEAKGSPPTFLQSAKPRALGATPPMELNVKGSGAIKWGLPSQTPRVVVVTVWTCRGAALT